MKSMVSSEAAQLQSPLLPPAPGISLASSWAGAEDRVLSCTCGTAASTPALQGSSEQGIPPLLP